MAKLKTIDPAYWMLGQGRKDPSKRSKPTVFKEGCYICEDEQQTTSVDARTIKDRRALMIDLSGFFGRRIVVPAVAPDLGGPYLVVGQLDDKLLYWNQKVREVLYYDVVALVNT